MRQEETTASVRLYGGGGAKTVLVITIGTATTNDARKGSSFGDIIRRKGLGFFGPPPPPPVFFRFFFSCRIDRHKVDSRGWVAGTSRTWRKVPCDIPASYPRGNKQLLLE